MSERKYPTGVNPLPSGGWRWRVYYRGETVSGVCATEADAVEMRRAALQKIVDGELAPTRGKSAKELGPSFLASRAKNRAADDDSSRWTHHIATAAWARKPVASVTKADGVAWMKALARKRVLPTPGQRKPMRADVLGWQTRKHCLNLARRFFAWCADHSPPFVGANPFAELELPREDGDEDSGYQETWYLDVQEQRKLLAIYDTFQDTRRRERWIVQFALGTGLRLGELCCLHLGDVHVDGDDPHVVVRFGSYDATKERFRSPKGRKGEKRTRIVPLFGLALEAAKVWIAQLHLYAPSNPLGLMFPTERGALRWKAPRSWRAVQEAFGKVSRIGEAPWWHLLRHTCASSMVSGWWGMRWSLEDVSRVLGHTDVRTTQIYAHLAPQAVAQTAARAHAAYAAGTYREDRHGTVTASRPAARHEGNSGRARRDSNPRPAASKAGNSLALVEGSALRDGRMTAVTALVAVLRDIAEGTYAPPIPVVRGLGEALELLRDVDARKGVA